MEKTVQMSDFIILNNTELNNVIILNNTER